MANILKLDSLDIYSLGMIRITDGMKKIIKFSNTEKKLFSWFTYYRENAVGEPKDLWDRIFKLLINRELLRFDVAEHMATKLRDRLNADIEEYHRTHASPGSECVPASVQTFHDEVRKATRIDEYFLYVEMNRAGHAELLTLGTVVDTVWQHQEKTLDDSAIVTQRDQMDRKLDFAKYMELRAKYFQLLDNQLQLSADLDDPVIMAAREAKEAKEAKETKEVKDAEAAKRVKAAKQAKKRQKERARKNRQKDGEGEKGKGDDGEEDDDEEADEEDKAGEHNS
jgi:hypothetical protein